MDEKEREAAIAELTRLRDEIAFDAAGLRMSGLGSETVDGKVIALQLGIDALVAAQSSGPGEGWTLVNERLPDEDGHFAVTVEPDASGFQWDTTAYWFDNELGWCEANREEYIPIKSPHSIIAWHKLPAPYGKESHTSGPGPRQALGGDVEASAPKESTVEFTDQYLRQYGYNRQTPYIGAYGLAKFAEAFAQSETTVLRQALEHYADADNWEFGSLHNDVRVCYYDPIEGTGWPDNMANGPDIARAALKAEGQSEEGKDVEL